MMMSDPMLTSGGGVIASPLGVSAGKTTFGL